MEQSESGAGFGHKLIVADCGAGHISIGACAVLVHFVGAGAICCLINQTLCFILLGCDDQMYSLLKGNELGFGW